MAKKKIIAAAQVGVSWRDGSMLSIEEQQLKNEEKGRVGIDIKTSEGYYCLCDSWTAAGPSCWTGPSYYSHTSEYKVRQHAKEQRFTVCCYCCTSKKSLDWHDLIKNWYWKDFSHPPVKWSIISSRLQITDVKFKDLRTTCLPRQDWTCLVGSSIKR